MTVPQRQQARKPGPDAGVLQLDDYRSPEDREAIARRRIVAAQRRRLSRAEREELEERARLWRRS
ncbi:MAG: hypothetical protein ACT4PM_10370 [Gemmatimonadales bacterium]